MTFGILILIFGVLFACGYICFALCRSLCACPESSSAAEPAPSREDSAQTLSSGGFGSHYPPLNYGAPTSSSIRQSDRDCIVTLEPSLPAAVRLVSPSLDDLPPSYNDLFKPFGSQNVHQV